MTPDDLDSAATIIARTLADILHCERGNIAAAIYRLADVLAEPPDDQALSAIADALDRIADMMEEAHKARCAATAKEQSA